MGTIGKVWMGQGRGGGGTELDFGNLVRMSNVRPRTNGELGRTT